MLNTLYRFLALVIIVFICGCKANNPSGLWFYTHSNGSNASKEKLLTPTSFIDLQRDGSYTRDFGAFDYGHWKMEKEQLVLTNDSNKTTEIPVKYLGPKDMQLITGEDISGNFEYQLATFKTAADDPFSLQNNKWRIKASHKETEAEIKARLYNHCQFWIAYFNWANDNQLEVVDVRSTPSLIKIYGNGFGLKPYGELPSAWHSYFYDSEDCKIANNLMYEVFQFHEISWAHTENKYKMFIGAFQQLQQFLQ